MRSGCLVMQRNCIMSLKRRGSKSSLFIEPEDNLWAQNACRKMDKHFSECCYEEVEHEIENKDQDEDEVEDEDVDETEGDEVEAEDETEEMELAR